MVGRKLVLKSERAESGSWTTYKVSPLVFGVYFVNVISVESTDITTTQMVLNLLKMMEIENFIVIF